MVLVRCAITAYACQPWTDLRDCYSEYLIIRFDYLIIPFDYSVWLFDYRVKYRKFLLAVEASFLLFKTIFVIPNKVLDITNKLSSVKGRLKIQFCPLWLHFNIWGGLGVSWYDVFQLFYYVKTKKVMAFQKLCFDHFQIVTIQMQAWNTCLYLF